MDSIAINMERECPVLKIDDDGLPVITYKGHNGAIATSAEDLDKLMFDGLSFWCPVESLRISVGDENVRKTPLTAEEIERYVSMVQELGDIGTLVVTEDSTAQNKLRILDGNNRFPIFVRECNPTHVFVKYVEVSSKLEEMRVQSIANTHTQTTHESEAFKALEAKTLTDDLPKDQRESELSFFYAEIAKGNRGKTEFTKRWKRAKYAITAVWQALSEGKITVEVIDHLATLIDPNTEKVLADLQQEILVSAIAQNLKASQVQTKCAAAFANWKQSQQVAEEDDDEEEFDLAPSSAPSRPTSAIAPKAPVPSTPKPPVEKVTAAAVVKQKQEVKATKGTGGKKASAAKTTASPKVTTNAPASIPNAIATNPNVHVAVIGRDEPKPKVNVDIFQELLDIEEALIKKSVVLSNGSGITQDSWDSLGKKSIADIDNILSQIQNIRIFLTKIEEAASAVQIDLRDQ